MGSSSVAYCRIFALCIALQGPGGRIYFEPTKDEEAEGVQATLMPVSLAVVATACTCGFLPLMGRLMEELKLELEAKAGEAAKATEGINPESSD